MGDAEFIGRTAYLYYIVIITPGVYLVVTALFARKAMPTHNQGRLGPVPRVSLFDLYRIQSLFK